MMHKIDFIESLSEKMGAIQTLKFILSRKLENFKCNKDDIVPLNGMSCHWNVDI
ncbi:MAG: hypothetical protein ACRCUY_05525 [Thermoguttaceae bacterium]